MKKLISTLLTISMLLSLVPVAFAAETTTLEKFGVKIVYDFSTSMIEWSTSSKFNTLTYDKTYDTNTYYSNSVNAEGHDNRNFKGRGPNGLQMVYSKLWYAAKIRVPVTGVYTASVKIAKYKSAGDLGVYMFNCDGDLTNEEIEAKLISENRLGVTINQKDSQYSTDAVWIEEPVELTEKEIEAGEYYLVFRNDSGTSNVFFGDFYLDGGEYVAPIVKDLSIAENTIEVGESVSLTPTVRYTTSGKEIENPVFSYESSDVNVAEVSKTGVITANCMGTASITVTANADNTTVAAVNTIDIIVTDPDAAGINLVYDFSSKMPNWGDSSTPFTNISYDTTCDMNEYYANNKSATGHGTYFKGLAPNGLEIAMKETWYAAKIRIPVTGKYIASVDIAKYYSTTGSLSVYLFKCDGDLTVSEIGGKLNSQNQIGNDIQQKDGAYKAVTWMEKPEELGVVDVEAGEYYLVMYNATGSAYAFFGDFYLDGIGDGVAPIITDCSVPKTILEKDESVDITSAVRYLTDGNVASNVAYTYESSDNNIASVDADGNITANNGGNATITVTATADGATLPGTRTIDLTVNTPEYTAAFKPSKTETEVITTNVETLVCPTNLQVTHGAEKNATGGTWHVKTDETVGDCTFLYWVRGLEDGTKKRIVSLVNEFDYAPQNGANYLIAVYTKDGEVAPADEYYNANGQLIATGAEPAKPYMLGYGQATEWIPHGNGIHEAKYGSVQSYTITVDGKDGTYNYGDPVQCVATSEKSGQKFFGWTKQGEDDANPVLVSADTEYTFYAWEDCEVKAVYKDEEPVFAGEKRKIFLDTITLGSDTAVMAEFIGFDDAVERGIILGTKSYAMTRKAATQFTIVNNGKAENISGYAILADGTKFVYNLK